MNATRELSNLPTVSERQCELCRQTYRGTSDLVGICRDCCRKLGGGAYSARIVKSELKAMERK